MNNTRPPSSGVRSVFRMAIEEVQVLISSNGLVNDKVKKNKEKDFFN